MIAVYRSHLENHTTGLTAEEMHPLCLRHLPRRGRWSDGPLNRFLNLIALPAWGRGTAKRRSGAFVNRLLETLFPALFHNACALSAPSGHLPLEGKADDTRMALSHKTFGHRYYLYIAALLIFMRRTTISHSSFLIPNSSFEQSFHSESVDGAAPRANPEPSLFFHCILCFIVLK